MVRETYIRNRGRPKRTLDEVIQKDMLGKGLSEGKNRDIAIWRRVIHVADPTLSGIRFTLMMMMTNSCTLHLNHRLSPPLTHCVYGRMVKIMDYYSFTGPDTLPLIISHYHLPLDTIG